jgi:hypothetical protein
MISTLGHYLNCDLLVAIPAVFDDATPRLCKLMGIEAAGLWLVGAELADRAAPSRDREPASIFVPFAQIAFLLPPYETRGETIPPPQPDKAHAKNPRKGSRLKRLPGN